MSDWLYFAQTVIILAQIVYWLRLRDDKRDDVMWDACLYPGGKE